jgi:putative heme-binding domain-containing protein
MSRCCFALVSLICLNAAFADEPPKTGAAAPGQTKGLEDALRNLRAPLAGGDPLPAAESLKLLKTQPDLRIDLLASEPIVRQPLHISFDERGRMWVVNYAQYPFPAGLKIVEYDRYIRAKFDKVPPPPPNHFKGADYITIHEDDGTGTFKKVKTFVEGLNIATSVLHGRGGVWIMNPPYLLFYPDKDRDDVPDGDPVVHLSGFGLEDTHAAASNLTWGPDGRIYGCQGSTCTAKVKVEITKETKTTDFLGQAIWRYHPEKHIFEIFAEGGGNTFGVEFDDQGRIYSGTNWGKYRGLHYVQGGYYVKGWGKHGPLTNPYALGFFEHMPHEGNADRLTHTYIVYGGDTLPERFHGKIIGPSPLQRRIHVTKREALGSSYRTVEEPFLVTSKDYWFRPVDLKAGPDGALYVADLYENRISHVDPRDNWDRQTGRVYRISANDAKPQAAIDLAKLSSAELVELLKHPNKWHRQTALRLLYDRKEMSVAELLQQRLSSAKGQEALETLWALHACKGFDETMALAGLGHSSPDVRRWAVRLLADANVVTPKLAEVLHRMARLENDPQVRSQLASSAKRLPPGQGLPIAFETLRSAEDASDVHIPLLTWWAIEAKAELPAGRTLILDFFADGANWRTPMVQRFVAERVVQRFAMAGGTENLQTCARLLHSAPTADSVQIVLSGLEKAFAGRVASNFPPELKEAIARALDADKEGHHRALGVRVGHPGALNASLKLVADEKAKTDQRVEYIRLLGEVPQPGSVAALLQVLGESKNLAVRREALTSLSRYDDPKVGETVVSWYGDRLKEESLVAAAQTMLASRAVWTRTLLQAIDTGKIPARSLPLEIVRQMQSYKDDAIVKLVEKHWGKVKPTTPAEKVAEMTRLAKLIGNDAAKGDEKAGKIVFTNTCAKCHKLFGEGAAVGPDLTGYERDNPRYWIENIADPSAVIRDEYVTFRVDTVDGRSLNGIIAAQDKATITLKLNDGQQVRLAREQIDDLAALTVSLMPEDVLKGLNDNQVRDLFAYLMSRVQKK